MQEPVPEKTRKSIADALWDCDRQVFHLPCVCDTPECHSEICVSLRDVVHSVEAWQRKMFPK